MATRLIEMQELERFGGGGHPNIQITRICGEVGVNSDQDKDRRCLQIAVYDSDLCVTIHLTKHQAICIADAIKLAMTEELG